MSDWMCCLCNEIIPRNVIVYRLHCRGSCGKIFHAKCLELTKEEYFDIKRKSGMNWMCHMCNASEIIAIGE